MFLEPLELERLGRGVFELLQLRWAGGVGALSARDADTAYLRVFARMSSRDAWLSELCQKGELSEIQMRVVRELLERVAFVPGGSGWSGR